MPGSRARHALAPSRDDDSAAKGPSPRKPPAAYAWEGAYARALPSPPAISRPGSYRAPRLQIPDDADAHEVLTWNLAGQLAAGMAERSFASRAVASAPRARHPRPMPRPLWEWEQPARPGTAPTTPRDSRVAFALAESLVEMPPPSTEKQPASPGLSSRELCLKNLIKPADIKNESPVASWEHPARLGSAPASESPPVEAALAPARRRPQTAPHIPRHSPLPASPRGQEEGPRGGRTFRQERHRQGLQTSPARGADLTPDQLASRLLSPRVRQLVFEDAPLVSPTASNR